MRLIDADNLDYTCNADECGMLTGCNHCQYHIITKDEIDSAPTVEAIPKAHVYKAIQEMMKYEHEGFINISLARLDEILKKCGVSEDGRN